jgi:hypothetical protein
MTTIDRLHREGRKRERQWQAVEDRLRALAPKALDVLEQALDAGPDPESRKMAVSVALAILRAAGLNGLPRPEAPSKEILRLQAAFGDLDDDGYDD